MSCGKNKTMEKNMKNNYDDAKMNVNMSNEVFVVVTTQSRSQQLV